MAGCWWLRFGNGLMASWGGEAFAGPGHLSRYCHFTEGLPNTALADGQPFKDVSVLQSSCGFGTWLSSTQGPTGFLRDVNLFLFKVVERIGCGGMAAEL